MNDAEEKAVEALTLAMHGIAATVLGVDPVSTWETMPADIKAGMRKAIGSLLRVFGFVAIDPKLVEAVRSARIEYDRCWAPTRPREDIVKCEQAIRAEFDLHLAQIEFADAVLAALEPKP